MEKKEVLAKIEDWEKRLRGLYTQVREWTERLPNLPTHIFEGSILQRDEEPVREFDIVPRMLPTLSIVYGAGRVSFTPSVLWTIGANGRVNISTYSHQFVLLDFGADGRPSDWQILTSRLYDEHEPFDFAVFRNIVLHEAIKAA